MASNSHERPVRPVARINTGRRASAPVDNLLWAAVKRYAVDHDRNMHVIVDEIFTDWLDRVGYLDLFEQEGER